MPHFNNVLEADGEHDPEVGTAGEGLDQDQVVLVVVQQAPLELRIWVLLLQKRLGYGLPEVGRLLGGCRPLGRWPELNGQGVLREFIHLGLRYGLPCSQELLVEAQLGFSLLLTRPIRSNGVTEQVLEKFVED